MDKILEIKKLKVIFNSARGFIKAVCGIDVDVYKNQIVSLVGESGCGKTVTCNSILKLLESPPSITKVDSINFLNKENKIIDLSKLSENEIQKIRGSQISMIFQDPNLSLNPVIKIGEQIDEVFIYHQKMKKKEAKNKTIRLLEKVGIKEPEKRYEQFPHNFSGGEKQRIIIAMAIANKPSLLIADEPTTALDVTIQYQILELLKKLAKEENLSVLFITHDLGVVNYISDYVYIMYGGKIVEQGPKDEIIKKPIHPYTKDLINSTLLNIENVMSKKEYIKEGQKLIKINNIKVREFDGLSDIESK